MREVIVSYADSSSSSDKMQLYRVNEDGSARTQLTYSSTQDSYMPSWSPNGQKIVYIKNTAHGISLWLSNPDGTTPRLLVGSGINMEPSWCPDSIHIVWFALQPGSGTENSRLWIMNTESMQSRLLFTGSGNLMPAVAPDGSKIAFVSNRSGRLRIWLSDLDGSNAMAISPTVDIDPDTSLPIEQKVPSWAPNGRIAHWEGIETDYLSSATGVPDPQRDALIEASWNVWVLDGSGRVKAGHGDDPIWSPDGFLTRSFPDQAKGGAMVVIQTPSGEWQELPILPTQTLRYGRFTWNPTGVH